MNHKLKFPMIIFCIFLGSLVLISCGISTSQVPSLVPTFSQTPQLTLTNIPLATPVITPTLTLGNKTFVLTPDDLFSLAGQEALNTPDSDNFCEHLPPPQIVANSDRLALLSGRFVLCPWESWPWIINTAIDLDTGSFVSKDDDRADIVMQNGHATVDGALPPFSVHSLNAAQIDEVTTDALSYEYCKQDLQSLHNNNIQGVLMVHDGNLACIKTTEGKIALIRVEEIYPHNTSSVEFSFAILKNE